MSKQTRVLPGIGEVQLIKRRKSKTLRIRVDANGQVKVSLPYWTPFQAGVLFATSKREWINTHKTIRKPQILGSGDRIGKYHRLEIINSPLAKTTKSVIRNNAIEVTSSKPTASVEVQAKIRSSVEKALKLQAVQLLPQRLHKLAVDNGYGYGAVSVRKMTSRWGSCSTKKDITLSYYLIQLPWSLIDYVLLHELVHTNHMNHGASFWTELEAKLPNAKTLRKTVRTYRPSIISDP